MAQRENSLLDQLLGTESYKGTALKMELDRIDAQRDARSEVFARNDVVLAVKATKAVGPRDLTTDGETASGSLRNALQLIDMMSDGVFTREETALVLPDVERMVRHALALIEQVPA